MNWDGRENRRFIRVTFPYTIIIRSPLSHAISTYTENISEGGVRVVITEELPLASQAELEIYLGNDPVSCQGKIVWVKGRESLVLEDIIVFDTGIEFCEVNSLSRDKIRAHVETFASGKKISR